MDFAFFLRCLFLGDLGDLMHFDEHIQGVFIFFETSEVVDIMKAWCDEETSHHPCDEITGPAIGPD